MAIDVGTYGRTVTVAPSMTSGEGVQALRRDPKSVLVAQEIATDFAVGPGDNLPLTVFPDDQDKSRNITFRVAGVFRSFPPSNPYAEMVMSTAGMPSYLLPPPDFYMARAQPGHQWRRWSRISGGRRRSRAGFRSRRSAARASPGRAA